MLRQYLTKRQIVDHLRPGDFAVMPFAILEQNSQAIIAARQLMHRQHALETAGCCLRPSRENLGNVIPLIAGQQHQHFFILCQYPYFYRHLPGHHPATNQIAAIGLDRLGYVQHPKWF